MMTDEEMKDILRVRPFTESEFGQVIESRYGWAHYPVHLDTELIWRVLVHLPSHCFIFKGTPEESEADVILKAYSSFKEGGFIK